MIVVCPGCKNQITVDEASVPKGAFKVRCTSCGRTITAQRKEEASTSEHLEKPVPTPERSAKATPVPKTTPPPESLSSPISKAVEEYVASQIATARKEILDAMQALFRGESIDANGGESLQQIDFQKRALICSGDAVIASTLGPTIRNLGYAWENYSTTAESLKVLDGNYGLVIVDPSFGDDAEGGKKIIGRINGKKGKQRRQTFVVLVSSTYKTMDGNSAFMNGVNLIVNKADIGKFDSIFQQSQTHFREMYAAFRSIADKK